MQYRFNLVVIGTGTAAATIAGRCRQAGWSVAIVDQLPYGGTCALRGCDPKKMLRRGPEVIDAAARMDGNGVVSRDLSIDWPKLIAFKDDFTEAIPTKREQRLAALGIATFHGTARFTGPNTLSVGEHRLEGRHIAVATGAEPRPLDIPGADLLTTSTEFMNLRALPRRVLFVGGGFIAFEFAHIAARAGAEVTVLTRGDRPLSGFDPDLVDRLVERSNGIAVRLRAHTEVTAIARSGSELRVRASVEGREEVFAADTVVHSAGRVPAIDALDLDKGGIKAGKKGIEVNEFLQSVSNPGVYAAGDVAATAGAPLTPVASLEGRTVADNLLNGNRTRPDYTGIPSVVFTIPALARVGLREADARDRGLDFNSRFSDMSDWFTARRARETHAAAKVLVDNRNGRILGAHLLGPESEELINLFALAMRSRLVIDDLKNFVSAYPSAASDIAYLLPEIAEKT